MIFLSSLLFSHQPLSTTGNFQHVNLAIGSKRRDGRNFGSHCWPVFKLMSIVYFSVFQGSYFLIWKIQKNIRKMFELLKSSYLRSTTVNMLTLDCLDVFLAALSEYFEHSHTSHIIFILISHLTLY